MSEKLLAIAKKACWLALVLMVTAQVQALTDPTRPGQYRPATTQAPLNLDSILFGESRKVAVINGRVLAEGDSIGGARVVAIRKDYVRLQRGGKAIRLELARPSIRQEH